MKILAIDIGGTAIKYGITDENFNVCEFYEIPSEAKLGRDHLMLKVLSIVGTAVSIVWESALRVR